MKKRISWNEARPGLIVQFRYKGKRTGISRVRECLLLDVNHRLTRVDGKTVRLIHAIQLKATPVVKGQRQVNKKQIVKIMETIGDLHLDPKTESIKVVTTSSPRNLYPKLSMALSRIPSPVYRTFDYRRANRNAVYVQQDFQFPADVKKRLQKLMRVEAKKIIKYENKLRSYDT